MWDSQNVSELRQLLASSAWPADLDADVLVLALLENLGSADPVLRDEVSYTLLERVLVAHRVSPEAVRALLQRAIDDQHLFQRIGAAGDMSVFQRSFSVLVAWLVLELPGPRGALEVADVETAHAPVLRYARTEQDRRGDVEGHGWPHSVAHTADALGALGCDPAVRDVAAVLEALGHLATVPHPLSFLEDDRVAWAVTQVMRAGRVSPDGFQRWLDGFERPAEEAEVRGGHAGRRQRGPRTAKPLFPHVAMGWGAAMAGRYLRGRPALRPLCRDPAHFRLERTTRP